MAVKGDYMKSYLSTSLNFQHGQHIDST